MWSYDTESVTVKEPVGVYCSGFYDGDKMHSYYTDRVNITAHRNFFLNFLLEQLEAHREGVVWVHNLLWDFSQLFADSLDLITGDKIVGKYEGATFTFYFSSPAFGVFEYKKRSIFIRDSFAFFTSSLKAIAAELGGVQKEEHPDGLGVKIIPWKDLRVYFEGDLKAGYGVGLWLTQQHRTLGIDTTTVSIPHFSSIMFRQSLKHPLKKFPYARLGLETYYGGKNRSAPGVYKNVSCYDVNSMYPHVMASLPKLCCGDYQLVKAWAGPWGIYRLLDYRFTGCEFGTLYHNKTKLKGEKLAFCEGGHSAGLNAHGWDIQSAFDCGSLTIKQCYGIVWNPAPCRHKNAFQAYIDRCWTMRKQALDKNDLILGRYYKLLMNSLYGKFSQLRFEQSTGGWTPGALFDSCIAGYITAKSRNLIHALEHGSGSVYTSTDSIFTFGDIPTGSALGELKHEFKADHLLILRNKVYFAFDKHYRLIKWAGHGIQAEDPWDVIEAFATGSREVTKKKLLRFREARRRKLTAGQQVNRVQDLSTFTLTPGMEKLFSKVWTRHQKDQA